MKKKFDCVEMKHRGALRIYEETKNLTFAEKLAYWQRKSEAALIRQAQRQKKLAKDRQAKVNLGGRPS